MKSPKLHRPPPDAFGNPRLPSILSPVFLVLCLAHTTPAETAPIPASHTDPQTINLLKKRIETIRSRYEQLRLEGDSDERLQAIVRRLLEAKDKGDWEAVRTILDSYERPVVEVSSTTTPDTKPQSEPSPTLIVEERKASYRSGDLLLTAYVYVPRAPGREPPYPGVLILHNNFLGTGLNARETAKAIASKYYTVMIAELRGYGRNPGKSEFALGEVDDTIAAFKALRSLDECDDRLKPAIIGDRHGANCALLAAARLGEKAGLVIAVNPYPDLSDALKSPRLRKSLAGLRLRLNRHDTRITLPRSPFYNVSGITCPVRLFYGRKNTTVPQNIINRYLTLLQARKVDAEIETFYTSGEDLFEHPFLVKKQIIKILEDTFRPRQKRSTRNNRRR